MNHPALLQPSVTAIIVNYKSGAYAVECIRSLLEQDYPALEIIVVDNASGDGSAETIRSTFGDRIRLLESPVNLGFGRANNLAASEATTDYLLLVNPDARLGTADFTARLIAYMESHPQIGIAGPEIYEPTKRKFVRPKHHYPCQRRLRKQALFKELPGPYAWILGACMCIRRGLYAQINGFDPDYFLYGEDTDICLRVRKAGFEVGYCEQAQLQHIGGASEAMAIPLDKFLRKKRGFYLFCRKHYPDSEVRRLAYASLASTYYASLRNKARSLLGWGNADTLQNEKQKIKATRIVIRETLDTLK